MEEKVYDAAAVHTAGVQFVCPHGEDKRKTLVWNEDHSDLEEVGEVDIQAEIDEAAKGMNAPEQIARIMRGDLSVLRTGEPYYGDVSGAPESEIDAMNNALAPDYKLEGAAQHYQMEIDELKAKIAALEEKEKNQEPAAEPAQEENK